MCRWFRSGSSEILIGDGSHFHSAWARVQIRRRIASKRLIVAGVRGSVFSSLTTCGMSSKVRSVRNGRSRRAFEICPRYDFKCIAYSERYLASPSSSPHEGVKRCFSSCRRPASTCNASFRLPLTVCRARLLLTWTSTCQESPRFRTGMIFL